MGETGERTSDMVARLAALQMRNTDAAARADAEFRELLSNSMAATNRAIGQMAIDIGSAAAGAASARGPLGGSVDADAFTTPPGRPPPPAGSWLNDPDDGAHDPTVFRLPSAPSKTLGYHDVMKGEASALKILGRSFA